jgi:flagellin
MQGAIESLSTGLRINSASDDVAGMAISSRMESTIRGLSQAIRNSSDGKNMFDTIEGASLEAVNILQRIRELAVQSANDSNTGLDRSFLQKELTQLVAEVDRISSHTTWNGKKVLDGTLSGQQIQIGMYNDEDITFSVDSASSGSIGNYEFDTVNSVILNNSAANAAAEMDDLTFTVVGSIGSKTITATAANAKQHAAIVNSVSAETGVTATSVTKVKVGGLTAAGLAVNGSYSMSIQGNTGTGISATAISFTIDVASDMRALRDAVNNVSGSTGITAKMDSSSNANIILTHSGGKDIMISDFLVGVAATTMTLTGLDKNEATTTSSGGTAVTLQSTAGANAFDDAVVNGHLSLNSHKTFTVTDSDTTTETSFFDTGGTLTATLSAISAINIGSSSGAESAILVIDGAINKINASRADLGAISNRLDNTISNLSNVVMNTESSISNIRDADFSTETSNLTRAQILTQAATAMLAQANASKQSVLSLLQG